MLSEAQMVKARSAVESLYHGTCTITAYVKTKKANGATAFTESVLYEDQPCRLSFSTIGQTQPNEDASSTVVQVVKLFLAPELQVPTGSKIAVTQYDVTTDYKASGKPAVYKSHQEIVLEIFKGWS